MLKAVASLVVVQAVIAPSHTASAQQEPVREAEHGTALSQTPESAYANTPAELQPYDDFHHHYKLFFDDQQPFLGAGRDKEAGAEISEVKIGFLGPLEGSRDAPLGRRMMQGAQLAIEAANANGGYAGLPFRIVARNDVGPWGASSNKFVELNDERVWAVLGSIDGASTHIALRVALKAELVLVTTGATDPTLTETRIPWYVRVNADDRQYSYALAEHIFGRMGHERAAVLRVNDRYGRTGVAEFNDAARRLGKPVLLELRFAPGDTSFVAQLNRIDESTAEAIVLWANAEDGAAAVRQMRALGLEHPVYGADRLVSTEFLSAAGAAAEGLVATYPFDPKRSDPAFQAFKQQYRDRFGKEPDAQAAHAYDGMNLIVAAVRSAGLNRVRIRDWLMEREYFDGVTGRIVFDPTMNDIGAVHLVQARDGAYVPLATPDAEEADALPDDRQMKHD